MSGDNIFSGLKVVDLASFIAGPSAAVILSDFGAEVIKVEPPSGDYWRHGNKIPPQPQAEDAYQWHLNNRNKRGLALDLKSPGAQQVLERLVKWADVLIVNTPHPARKRLGSTTWRRGTLGSSTPTSLASATKGRMPISRASISRPTGHAAACCR
jgi:formyl-CoA transferase